MTLVSALTFDFNGTLSNDEPILCGIFQELFRRRGRPLSEQEYYDELAGLSDEGIVMAWLGEDYPDVTGAVAERIQRYRDLVADGSTIEEPAREAVRLRRGKSADRDRLRGGSREIVPVVRAAGLEPLFEAIVSSDDVREGKPHPGELPEGARAAGAPRPAKRWLSRTPSPASPRRREPGCAASRFAARLRPRVSAGADELIETIDVDIVRRLLDGR